jgi:hypothetical protein
LILRIKTDGNAYCIISGILSIWFLYINFIFGNNKW